MAPLAPPLTSTVCCSVLQCVAACCSEYLQNILSSYKAQSGSAGPVSNIYGLHCVAMCCGVLWFVAVCSPAPPLNINSMLHCGAVWYSVYLRYIVFCCSVLQCFAVFSSVLQCYAVSGSVWHCWPRLLCPQYVADVCGGGEVNVYT